MNPERKTGTIAEAALRIACALPLLASAFAAVAADSHTINTYTCRPDRTTRLADLVFRPGGIKNDTARTQYVVCPLMRDEEAPYARFYRQLTVVFSYYNESNQEGSAGASCMAYETDRALGITKTLTGEGGSPAEYGFSDAGSVYAGYEYEGPPEIQGQLSLRCSISPGALLFKIVTMETTTDAAP
jgi:hypothetical protein